MATVPALKAPFPYFGGKSRVADLVWERLGDVSNYVEPFAGSAAMLLRRPTTPNIETLNDVNSYVANFWRATQRDPESVVDHADAPVNEADLHARHRWLVLSAESVEFRQRMRTDPDYFDVKIAGWWCWGACCWIGGGWCTPQGETADGDRKETLPAEHGKGITAKRPRIEGDNPGSRGKRVNAGGTAGLSEKLPDIGGAHNNSGRGVHASRGDGRRPRSPGEWEQVPNLGGWNGDGQGGIGVHQKRPNIGDRATGTGVLNDQSRPQLADGCGRGVHSHDVATTCADRRAWLLDWFDRLRDRLRTVRVCCGHWQRVCESHSVTTRLGTTGIFLDPPYPTHQADGTQSRDGNLYSTDGGRDELDKLRDEVLAYCRERGSDLEMRIAVCGYDTDGYATLEALGWECVPWRAAGGYGNRSKVGKANAGRERIWFSPGCLSPTRQPERFGLLNFGD